MASSLQSDNIILIGFMGSGKSSIGRSLAQKTNYQFLDTDTLIESSQGRSISEIFASEGERYFRSLESALMEWISKHVEHAIVATGGGLPIFYETLQSAGTVIYLECSFDTITKRIIGSEQEKRPLFEDDNKAIELFNMRQPQYQNRSNITVDANRKIDLIVDEIVSTLSFDPVR